MYIELIYLMVINRYMLHWSITYYVFHFNYDNVLHFLCTYNALRILVSIYFTDRKPTGILNRTFTYFNLHHALEMIDDLRLWFNVWDKQISSILVCLFRISKCSCYLINQLSKMMLSMTTLHLHLKDSFLRISNSIIETLLFFKFLSSSF